MIISQDQIRQLAKTQPQEAVKLLSGCANDISTITDIVEILSEEVSDETIMLPLFKRLLKHVHVLVRESTILGISNFYIDKKLPTDILNKLESISKSDPSSDLREFSSDMLKNFK